MFSVNEFFSVGKLDVHVGIDADQTAFIFGLAPFQSYYYVFVNTETRISTSDHAELVLCATHRDCSIGRGLTGVN